MSTNLQHTRCTWRKISRSWTALTLSGGNLTPIQHTKGIPWGNQDCCSNFISFIHETRNSLKVIKTELKLRPNENLESWRCRGRLFFGRIFFSPIFDFFLPPLTAPGSPRMQQTRPTHDVQARKSSNTGNFSRLLRYRCSTGSSSSQ